MEIVDFIDDDDNLDALDLIIYGIPRQIYIRSNYFHTLSDFAFFQRFRLTKYTVLELLVLIENDIEFYNDINNSVSPMNQLLICLRIFATGGHLLSIGDFSGVHKSTVSRIVKRVSEAIARLAPRFIKLPTTNDEIMRTQNTFFNIASFPKVIGALDCTHIRIQSPGGDDAEVFRNRKSYFSINVQAICNADLEFTNIVARWPGSSHDATIFNNCRIRAQFEEGNYPNCILLGDSGYPTRSYLLTPLLNPNTPAKCLYNESHIRTRVKIENIFGIWKRRFPILAYGCRLKVQTTITLIIAAGVLHNIARKQGEEEPPPDPNIDQHVLQQLIVDGRIPPIPFPNAHNIDVGFEVRENLINDYFGRLYEL